MTKNVKAQRKHLLKEFQRGERYRYVHDLGEGGVGLVVSCFDTYLNRVAAMKTLKSEHTKKLRPLQSMIKEARLMSYLNHPGVVSVYDAFVSVNGEFSYTMKLIEGEELESYLFRSLDDDLSLTQYLEIFVKLFETMAYVHDKGVIHLDLKPQNVMFGKYGEVLVVDWGNARLYDEDAYEAYMTSFGCEDKASDLEETEQFISGTPKYMSPEQTALSRDQLVPASDIFSVGVFLYEIISKKHPFPAETLEELLEQIHFLEPPPLHTLRANVPKRMSQICSKMMAKKVEHRYQNFHEVLKDIRELLDSGHTFETRRYESNDIIFREGDPGGYAFFVLSGYVEISTEVKGERKFLATLGEGEIIGELSIFNKQPRTATAKAVVPTVIKVLTEDSIERELEKLSPWVGQMITSLSGRFVELSRKYVELEAKTTS